MPNSNNSNLLPDWLGRAAAGAPEKLALRCGGEDWTFGELDRRASSIARRLAGTGVREGSRVALLAGNSLLFAAAVHALTRLGAVLVPLNTRLTVDELRWQVADVRAEVLLCDERWSRVAAEIGATLPDLSRYVLGERAATGMSALDTLPDGGEALRTEIDLDAVQAIMYTSGTTGSPKGAILTYGMQWWSAAASALNLGLREDDRWLVCLPFFHVSGLTTLFKSAIYQMPIVVHERFDAAAVNASIVDDRISIVSVVAVMLQRMLAALDAEKSGGSYPAYLRCALLGGGPAPRPLLEGCARRGVPVVQTYGLTESCSQAATLAPTDALRKLGSAGRPLLPVRLRIMREGGEARPGEAGEIELCGPTITPGYADRREATEAAFHDGWLRTGDLGHLDAEGYLYLLDRRSDLIISGGENVYPAEVEATLLAHPDVEEAGVCGMPDAEWGQVPVAFVRLSGLSATTPDDLAAFVATRLARYKAPRRIYLADALPRNAAGKLLRRELPALLAHIAGDGAS